MKKLLSLFLLVFISIQFSQSQVPQSFNYQAVVRDASGAPLNNQSVAVIISIHQSTMDGTEVFTETHSVTTNEFGLINLKIGTVNSAAFILIDWANGPYFIKVNVNGTELGGMQVLSVPYAMYADKAGNIFSGDYYDLTNQPDLSGYLSVETDPIFSSHVSNSITSTNLTNWATAYNWGDHSTAGYLSSYTETDPIFLAHPAYEISSVQLANWDVAYNWGDHSQSGYLTSYTETDPIYTAWNKSEGISITESQITDLVHFTTADETDPVFGAHAANIITSSYIINWNNAFAWGNHSLENYLKVELDGSITNELQNLSLLDDTLRISNGNFVDLKRYVYTAGNGIQIGSGNQISFDLTNSSPGDMVYYDGSEWSRIPIGENGQLLSIVNGIPTWQDRPYHYIGEEYGGGIVFWVDDTHQHGLVVSIEELTNSARVNWGGYGQLVGASSWTDGFSNTNIIVNALGDNSGVPYAAKLCKDYRGGGFDDWYLPVSADLKKLFYASKSSTRIDIPSTVYWCSTEISNTNAWILDFNVNYTEGSAQKNANARVYAIRSF